MYRMSFVRLAVLAVAGLAALPLASAQSKLAIINLRSAVIETAEIKKAQAELQTKFAPRQTQLETLQKDLAGLQQQLQSGQGKLTPQKEQELQLQGQRKQREYERLGTDLQEEVDRERNEILGRAGQRMQDVVKKMAEEKGLDLVIDVSNTVFFKPALDVTKDAITAYDRAYPAK